MRPLSTGPLYGNLVRSSDENPDNFVVCTRLCSITSWFAARYILFAALTRLELIVAAAPRRKHLRREQQSMALIAHMFTYIRIANRVAHAYRLNTTAKSGRRTCF